MPYQVGYQVKDHSSYNDFGHQESSDSQGVKGSYRVLLPDGRTQVVTYSVQGNSGYLATVSYEDSNYSPAINNGHKSTSYQAKPNVEYNSNKSTYSPPTTPKPYIAAPYTTTTVPYDHYTTKANRQQYNKASAHNYQQTNKPSVQQYNNKASVKPYPTGAQNYDSTIKPSTQHYQPAEKPSSHLYQTTDEPATQHYQPAQTPNLYHFQAIDKPTTPSYQFPDTAIQHYIVVDKIPAEYYTLAETSIPTAQYLPPNNRKKPQEEVGWPSGSVESYLPKNAVIGQNKGSDNVRTECVVTNAPAPAQWSQISGGQSTSYNVPGNDPPAVSSSSSNTATGTFGQRYSRRKPSVRFHFASE